MAQGLFGDLSYAQPKQQYLKKDLTPYINAGLALNKQYDEGVENNDKFDLLVNNYQSRDELTPQLKETLDVYRQKLKTITEKGDYENSSAAIRGLAKNMVNDPLLKEIQDDKALYDAHVKRYQDLAGKPNGISEKDFKESLLLDKTNYNKRIEIDLVTGLTKNKFQGRSIPLDINIEERVQKILKDIENSTLPSDFKQRAPRGFINISTAEGRTPQQLRKAAFEYVMSQDDIQNLLEFRANNAAELQQFQGINQSLKEFDKSSLIKTGVIDIDGMPKIDKMVNGKPVREIDTKAADILYNEDGTINQEGAKALLKHNYKLHELDKIGNFAEIFANKKDKLDWKEDYETRTRDKEAFDMYKIQEARDYQTQKEIKDNQYYDPFKILPGETSSIDPAMSKTYGLDQTDLSQIDIRNIYQNNNSKSDITVPDRVALQNFQDAYSKIIDPKRNFVNQRLNKMIQVEGKLPQEVQTKLNAARAELNKNPKLANMSNEELLNYKFTKVEKESNEYKEYDAINKILAKLPEGQTKSILQGGDNVKRHKGGDYTYNMQFNFENEDLLKGLSEDEKETLTKAKILVVNPNTSKDKNLKHYDEEGNLLPQFTSMSLRLPVKANPTVSGNVNYGLKAKRNFSKDALEGSRTNFFNYSDGTAHINKENYYALQKGIKEGKKPVKYKEALEKIKEKSDFSNEKAEQYLNDLFDAIKSDNTEAMIMLYNLTH